MPTRSLLVSEKFNADVMAREFAAGKTGITFRVVRTFDTLAQITLLPVVCENKQRHYLNRKSDFHPMRPFKLAFL